MYSVGRHNQENHMTVAENRTIDNTLDVGRKIPTAALADAVLKSGEAVTLEELPGTNATAIELSEAITGPVVVLAFVTASGAGAARTLLRNPNEFTVVNKNPNGVGEITPTGDQSANTLLVFYSPDQPDAPLGGASTAFSTDI